MTWIFSRDRSFSILIIVKFTIMLIRIDRFSLNSCNLIYINQSYKFNKYYSCETWLD